MQKEPSYRKIVILSLKSDFKRSQKPEEVVNLQSNADDAGQKANTHQLCVDRNN